MRMRLLYTQIRMGLAVAGLAAALSGPAAAGTLYKWVTEDGTVAFTDDAKRIPKRYRDEAEARRVQGLGDYPRFTPQSGGVSQDYRERLAGRLEELREMNATVGTAARTSVPGTAVVSETVVQVDDRMALRIPTGAPGDGPLIVEEVRVRPKGRIFTHHNTVVRRGDRILAVVRPDRPYEASPDEFVDESELLR